MWILNWSVRISFFFELCYYISGEIMRKILTLVIDGIGESANIEGNALKAAHMPNYQNILENNPHSLLEASGEAVGMREGTPGNAEIGYKTLAAGQIIRQRSSFMNEFVDIDSLATNPSLKEALEQAKKKRSTIHVIGLMSDGGRSSNIKDTVKIIEFLKKRDVKVVIDVIADGKDVEAKSLLDYIAILEKTDVPIATICGRYYAMDDENKWDRTKIYYDLIRNGVGLKIKEIPLALKNCYMRDITDEFLPPIIVEDGRQLKNNDVIIWTNYETESSKEILLALTNPDEVSEFETVAVNNLKVLMMYTADPKIKATALIEEEDDMANSLGVYLGKLQVTQARVALEASYDYVTYYFNGETEDKIPKCNNYLVEVPKIETDRQSELGAAALTKQVIRCMEKDTDFILASIDIVDEAGHNGDYEEAVKRLEFVDECLGRIMESAAMNFYTVVITSTHGNIEEMYREENKTATTNTVNRVPFIITDPKLDLKDGSLKDVAPTLLTYMDISIPDSMKKSKILIK